MASCCDTRCVPQHVAGLQGMLREGSGDNKRLCSCKKQHASVVLLNVWKYLVFEVFGRKRKTLAHLSGVWTARGIPGPVYTGGSLLILSQKSVVGSRGLTMHNAIIEEYCDQRQVRK